MTSIAVRAEVDAAVAQLVDWLETGTAPDGLLAADCFTDLTLPHWREQFASSDGALTARRDMHPFPGTRRIERADRTENGFVIAFEERWRQEGQDWYCREQISADVNGRGEITELRVYCTGDWDEARQAAHAAAVTLLRP